MNNIFGLILLGLMTSLVQSHDCPYQKCNCGGTEVLCGYQNLQAMPPKIFNFNINFTSLYLDGNQITTIPAGSLLANLSIISLESDPIETIDDTAFDESIYTLQKLYFQGARFTHIPQAVFHLKALKTLEIYQTNILVWDEDGMNQLGSTMQTLTLNNVGLTVWPTWMKTMTNLTQLIISGCSISTIPDDALDAMANNLKGLDISNNSLTKLPKSISKLTVLNTLTLNFNRIVDVTWLPQSSHFNTLSLVNNNIRDAVNLSNALRPCAQTLSSFSIQNNSLTSIPELSFLSHISYLSFQYNHLTDANSGSFPANITTLDFQNNLLTSIPSIINSLNHLTFLYLESNNIQFVQGSQIPICVTYLDLSLNSISQLTRTSFPNNSSLIDLTLNNNPLTTISLDAFSNIPLLTYISLQNTKLTRLPLSIASLTKLNLLDVSNSNSLVCTCQEHSLRPLIVSINFYGVIGNCGVTSVYFFFETLSPLCPQI